MARESCISHRPRQTIAIIRQDYYELMDQDSVAACLLNEFEHRANAIIVRQPDIDNPWLGEITIREFEKALLGISTDKQIRARLKILEKKGFIETRQPKAHRKTLEYRLMICKLQSDLNRVNAAYFTADDSEKASGQTTVDPTVKQPLTQKANGQTTVDPTVKQPLESEKANGQTTVALYTRDLLIKEDLCIEQKTEDTHTLEAVITEIIAKEEVSDRTSQDSPDLRQLNNASHIGHNNSIDSLDQCSEAARDNKVKAPRFLVAQQRIDELEELYGNGDNLGSYTQEELQALADRVMCDRVYLYRVKTRKILGQHVNDLDRGFLKFFAWRYWNDEQATKKAADTIRSYEKDPTKWQSLCLSVDEWQEFMSNPDKFKQEAIARAGKKGGGSQVDQEIAAQSDADRFRKLQRQQAASVPPVVDSPQSAAVAPQKAASPESANNQAKGTVERSPMPEDFKKQLQELRQQQRSKPA